MENVLLEIQKIYQTLRPSERRAADFILDHADQARRMSLEELAARDRETMSLYGCRLTREDRPADIPEKIVAAASRMMLAQAEKIDIFSVENSNATAADLETKLLYLGLNCRRFVDSYHQRIAADSMKPGEAAIGITYSGCSKDTVDALRIARERGAVTIVMTNFRDSVISRYADHLICTSQEQHMYGDAIFSRTSQILVVDMLYLAIIATDYDRYLERLRRSEYIIRDKAYQSGNSL